MSTIVYMPSYIFCHQIMPINRKNDTKKQHQARKAIRQPPGLLSIKWLSKVFYTASFPTACGKKLANIQYNLTFSKLLQTNTYMPIIMFLSTKIHTLLVPLWSVNRTIWHRHGIITYSWSFSQMTRKSVRPVLNEINGNLVRGIINSSTCHSCYLFSYQGLEGWWIPVAITERQNFWLRIQI